MNYKDNIIEIYKLTFRQGNRIIFNNVNMHFLRGKITSIIGPSGIGKTTLLRLISGQFLSDSGEIWIDGNNIAVLSRNNLYKIRKKISMLFQSDALFTDLTVFENVAFPLRRHSRLPEPILYSTVLMKLETVGLREMSKVMPSNLSGGMSRRTALARAIALDPELIMLDEPFVGQDPITMRMIIDLISNLNHKLGVTFIIVSHDIPEVLNISDYIYIIFEENLIIEGTPISIYDNENPRVKQFLHGITNVVLPSDSFDKNYYTHLLGKWG